jgi:hypothetical protein
MKGGKMADIISLEARLRKQREETFSQEKKKRFEAFRSTLQCVSCPMKCAKCGSQLEVPQPHVVSEALPLGLCLGCREEYRLYERIIASPLPVEGQEYYHNQHWIGVWKSWVEYQRSLHKYRHSQEFLRLMEELAQD